MRIPQLLYNWMKSIIQSEAFVHLFRTLWPKATTEHSETRKSFYAHGLHVSLTYAFTAQKVRRECKLLLLKVRNRTFVMDFVCVCVCEALKRGNSTVLLCLYVLDCIVRKTCV